MIVSASFILKTSFFTGLRVPVSYWRNANNPGHDSNFKEFSMTLTGAAHPLGELDRPSLALSPQSSWLKAKIDSSSEWTRSTFMR
jgi:hypothetical protein